MLRPPLRRSDWLSSKVSADVYLKLETLQPTFSYKIRGAWNAVLALRERGEQRAIVTASAGNHGRALAHAGTSSGFPVRVYVPATAPRIKLDAIRASGADVRECGDYDDAETQAKRNAEQTGAMYISPYSHADVIAGAGTIGLEILEDLPETDTIVVPVGGGGLISGIALAVHEGGTTVMGVEAAASSPFAQSLAAGRIVPITVQPTLADGLAGNLDPDTITFDIVRRLVARFARATEEEIGAALRGIIREERLIAEGAAATAVAAVLKGGQPELSGESSGRGQRIVIVLSGANIDPEKLRTII